MIELLVFIAAAAAPPPADATTARIDDPIICERRSTSDVGTHMRAKRVCMRKSDWDYQRKHTRRELEDINQRGNNPAPSGEDRAAPR